MALTYGPRKPGSWWGERRTDGLDDSPWHLVDPDQPWDVTAKVMNAAPGNLDFSKGLVSDHDFVAVKVGGAEKNSAVRKSEFVPCRGFWRGRRCEDESERRGAGHGHNPQRRADRDVLVADPDQASRQRFAALAIKGSRFSWIPGLARQEFHAREGGERNLLFAEDLAPDIKLLSPASSFEGLYLGIPDFTIEQPYGPWKSRDILRQRVDGEEDLIANDLSFARELPVFESEGPLSSATIRDDEATSGDRWGWPGAYDPGIAWSRGHQDLINVKMAPEATVLITKFNTRELATEFPDV